MSDDLIKRSDALLECEALTPIDCKMMKKRINDIPSAEKQGEWIPCSERLPNKGEVVLVCMRIENHKAEWEEQRSIEFGRISSDRYDYDGTGWEWLNESGADYWQADWNHSILAWMSLPEPYTADTPQTDRMTEEEIDTMLAKVLVGQTDCGWK